MAFWTIKNRASLRVIVIAALGVAAPWQMAAAETLQDALIAAYNGNPELGAERARLRATDENVPIARAGWMPKITLQASYGYVERRAVPAQVFTDGSLNTRQQLHPNQGSAQLIQPLFHGDTLYEVRQRKAEVRAGEANLATVEQNVLLSTVTAYMNVLRDQALVELNRNNVEVLNRQLDATKDRFDVGELTRTDVAQAEARLSGSRSALIQAEADLTASRAGYERAVGQQPGTLEQPSPLPQMPATQEEALGIAVKESPLLIAAREQERASRLGVGVARAGMLPEFDFVATVTHNEESSIPTFQSSQKSFVAQVTVPLYQGGAEYARIRQARQVNSQRLMDIAAAERQTTEGVANAWEFLRASKSKIQSDQEQVRANEIAYEGVRQEAQVGSRTTLDVLDAEQELLNARVALVGSTRNEYVAGYQLLSAVGRLSAQDLGLAVEPYDPERYFNKVHFKPIGWDIGTRDKR